MFGAISAITSSKREALDLITSSNFARSGEIEERIIATKLREKKYLINTK